MPALRSPLARRAAAAALHAALHAAAVVGLLAAPAADSAAQSITASCSVVVASQCSALRLDVLSGAAPLSLLTLGVQLGAGWTFVGGALPTFTGEDDFSFGTPFTGTALSQGTALVVDFLASPGFSFELAPGSAGYLQFAVSGVGAAPVTFSATDPDGGSLGGTNVVSPAAIATPEPATTALLGAGLLALGAAARRRRAVAR